MSVICRNFLLKLAAMQVLCLFRRGNPSQGVRSQLRKQQYTVTLFD